MARVTYTGPGDAITVDGITLEKGTAVELLPEQVAILRRTQDAELQIEDAPDTAEDRERIRADHDAARDKAAADAAAAAAEATKKRAAPKRTRKES